MQTNYDEIKSEKFDQAQDLFAAILAKGVARQKLACEFDELSENNRFN